MKALIKIASKEREVGFLDTQKASWRASRRSDKGIGKHIAKDDWIKPRLNEAVKGALVGSIGGALVGAAIGKGEKEPMGHGALLGAALGGMANIRRGNIKRLNEAGIKTGFGLKSKMDKDTYNKYVGNYK